jgi:hypothetical protein
MLISNLLCQQLVMLIYWLLINLTNQFNKKPITNYHNKHVICYPIITKTIFKIILLHQAPIGNNWLLYT